MIGKILVLLAAFSATAKADLTAQDIRDRLEVRADTYVFDESGKHVLAGPERTSTWKVGADDGVLRANWSSDYDGSIVATRQEWKVEDDGTIKVEIEEYSSVDKNNKMLGLLDHKEFTVTNFEPIVWKVKNVKNKNFVIRFVPSLREIRKPIAIDSLPVSGSKITISDNAGYLWADGAEFNGKYVGIRSHRGTLALSYVPFKGAKELGSVEGNEMVVNVDKKFQINLHSATGFLPAGVTAKVYAVYLPEKKSKGVNSLHTWDTSREERNQEALSK